MKNDKQIITINEEIEFAKIRYGEYHKRLLQEYDLSWQQLKISIYIASLLLILYGTLYSYQVQSGQIAQVKYVLYILPIAGIFISISSLIILFGSLKSAQSIRECLSNIEDTFDENKVFCDSNRYLSIKHKDFVKITGEQKVDLISFGKILLQLIIIAFWIFLHITSNFNMQ